MKDEIVDAEQVRSELEEKFMAILSQPDVVVPSEEIDGEFTEEQRATLQAALVAELPSPEEVEQEACLMEHNQKVYWARQADLARRRVRRAKQGTRKKHRRG
jgi:hypothetical protein